MLNSLLLVIAFTAGTLAQIPDFVLNCTLYPDVCDNTCNAVYCHGLSQILHYDAQSNTDMPNPPSMTTAAGYRRANIGCGSSNYCSGTGLDCDEFPYASTFDGGVGCIAARFTGPAASIAQSGTTRCATPAQNRAHGAQLAAFYAAQNLASSSSFRVMFNPANVDQAPLCRLVRPGGAGTLANCPDDSTGLYRFRSTPAASFCPSRSRVTAGDSEDSEEDHSGDINESDHSDIGKTVEGAEEVNTSPEESNTSLETPSDKVSTETVRAREVVEEDDKIFVFAHGPRPPVQERKD